MTLGPRTGIRGLLGRGHVVDPVLAGGATGTDGRSRRRLASNRDHLGFGVGVEVAASGPVSEKPERRCPT